MEKHYKMTQSEMDEIIAINKQGGDPVMYLSGGTPMGRSLQEKINDYWDNLAAKYGFIRATVKRGDDGPLSFYAEENPTK